MKLLDQGMNKITQGVTPLAGVWIEIVYLGGDYGPSKVTPLAGVWIEISQEVIIASNISSLPSRECGLKYLKDEGVALGPYVTPLAGVWIEI